MTSSPRPRKLLAEYNKIANYLLSPTHRDGAPKAKFFLQWGFTQSKPDALAFALFEHATGKAPTATEVDVYATKFVFEGPIVSPKGLTPPVRSVWEQKTGEDTMRLLTAYPFY